MRGEQMSKPTIDKKYISIRNNTVRSFCFPNYEENRKEEIQKYKQNKKIIATNKNKIKEMLKEGCTTKQICDKLGVKKHQLDTFISKELGICRLPRKREK